MLAATPPLKALGIKTGSRLYEIPNRSDIYITNPKMRTYINLSTKISKIAINYSAPEDFHQYSIDEFFLDLTDSYKLFGDTLREIVTLIQEEIYNGTGIKSTIGIGSNMLLAKVAMDIEAKHNESGIAEWRYQDIPNKLWKINNLTDMWGINSKTANKLNKRGIFTIEDLAKYPYVYLKRDFGKIGVDLHLHANGIDESVIRKPYKTKNKGLGKSQILLRDYTLNELKAVLIEEVEDVSFRSRAMNMYPTTISVSVGYADGGGIRRQYTEKNGFKSTNSIIEKLWNYILENGDRNELYRTISVSFTNFKSNKIEQLELFKPKKEMKSEIIDHAMDYIKLKYGKDIIMRASSLSYEGTLKHRKGLLAGHKA